MIKKVKMLSLLLALMMLAAVLGGCATSPASANSDFAYIKNKGTLIIGITQYPPMNFFDAEGKLTGFDTEFAEAVCKKLGLKAEFVEINWDSKEVELNSKNIDCIWNGMCITEERKKNMSISDPYMNNEQAIVDATLAFYNVGPGTDFEELVANTDNNFGLQQFGIAFRKDSDVTAKVNDAIKALQQDGTLAKIAANYGLEDALIK